MYSRETKELSKAMKKYAAKLSKNPKAAKAFLIEAGILTKKRKLPDTLQTPVSFAGPK